MFIAHTNVSIYKYITTLHSKTPNRVYNIIQNTIHYIIDNVDIPYENYNNKRKRIVYFI